MKGHHSKKTEEKKHRKERAHLSTNSVLRTYGKTKKRTTLPLTTSIKEKRKIHITEKSVDTRRKNRTSRTPCKKTFAY